MSSQSKIPVYTKSGIFLNHTTVRKAQRLALRGTMDIKDGRAILLLTKKDRKERRNRIISQAKGICYLCEKQANNPTIDHMDPLVRDGLDVEDNLACCCAKCNSEKADLFVDEYLIMKEAMKNLKAVGYTVKLRPRGFIINGREYIPELYVVEKDLFIDIKAGFDNEYFDLMQQLLENDPDINIKCYQTSLIDRLCRRKGGKP